MNIQFEGVGHAYAERVVLREVNLSLTQQRIGIVGANGSGKSTLARMINGLVLPTAGRVLVDGLDTAKDAAKIRSQVGFVFTDPDAQIVMPLVGEDIAFSLRRRKLTRAQTAELVRETAERFGLGAHLEHPAHLLSGGQKQLLALAAVMVTQPRTLVCDEPTTLLDARNSALMERLLAGLEQQVIMVTHDLEALRGFDRVIVVEQGAVVADDEPGPALAAYRELVGRLP